MAWPAPAIGLVIRHAYLWWNEARGGREEEAKDRPCVIVHFRDNEHGQREVYIAPVTHMPPIEPERALEIPATTKRRLGLDDARSWIITTEVNRFIWPEPDLRPVPGGAPAYGPLPASMARDLVRRIRENARDRALLTVARDDEPLNKEIRRRQQSSDDGERER